MSTNTFSSKDIKRNWHLVDAKDKILGRLASEVATKLMGKHKVEYVPYLDNGDIVVVTNAKEVKVTGRKATDKVYYRHSGFPGGFKSETFDKLIDRRPTEVIKHAVKGMLPKSKLGKQMIKKLHIYEGGEHPYEKQVKGDSIS